MPSPTLPFEILDKTFRYLPNNISDAIKHHLNHTDLFNCSLVSRDWRAAALPLLWHDIKFYCGETTVGQPFVPNDKIWPRLSDSLMGERADAPPGHIDRASYLRGIELTTTHLFTRCVAHNITAVVRILQLIPSQLRRIKFSLSSSASEDLESHIGVLQMILLSLAQNLEDFTFFDDDAPRCGISHSVFPYAEIDSILKNIPKSLRTLSLGADNLSEHYSILQNFSKVYELGTRISTPSTSQITSASYEVRWCWRSPTIAAA
ncbi:hypothetical protein BC936DRAFT_138080 [Jimgerdemannia flammicorona]|uniref:F-box domain-containing protein n=1 Tax=Jimgerdemannia flammicorona TaxID=994334 RepID=A0A433CVZ0_9FUNG|nr:hypothetical protein BC936DRAFT_138080 [Jimgerdemannia flammicorona]